MFKYLAPFLTAFVLTIFFSMVAIWIGQRIDWRGRADSRHIHKKGIFRIGGLAMVSAFAISVLFDPNLYLSPEIYGFMLGAFLLMLLGIWDDIKELFWKIQLFFQISIALLIFIFGIRIYYISNPFFGGIINLDSGFGVIISAVLVVLWIVLIMNAINWSDGIDGLSGSVSFIASATIFALSLSPDVNQPPVAILCAIFCGVLLGFLVFNFYPSRILAGTSGAMFMGYVLAVLAIIAGTKIATALLVLAVPVIDSLWVIGERIRTGRSVFHPDKNHLHYKLLGLGWSQRRIVAVYILATVLIAIVALKTRVIGKSVTFLVSAVIMAAVYAFMKKYLKEHE